MPITRHRLHRCTNPDCTACNNRVPVCEACQGIDTSLPTDCPGVVIPEPLRSLIGEGRINYREGYWRSENNMRKPNSFS